MADKDQYNDEYQFADLDAITPDSGEDGELPSGDKPPISEDTSVIDRLETNSVKRNALIVVVLVVFIMIIYKFMGSVFSTPKPSVKATVPTMTATAATPVAIQTTSSQPVSVPAPVAQVSNPSVDTQINQKLSALEVTQQSMRTDVSSVSSQIGGISTSLNTLLAKIVELEGVVSTLNTKLDDQSRVIAQLTAKRTAKTVHHTPRSAIQHQKYYIQAVIPGRAWLIATNGSTLTVREGTTIAGYGMVKLIDPNQGRVTTSSGQIIRFSQEDS